jgi:hypothetical protein
LDYIGDFKTRQHAEENRAHLLLAMRLATALASGMG